MKEHQQYLPVALDGAQRQAKAPALPTPTAPSDHEDLFTLKTLRIRAEIEGIQRALSHTGWNRTQAARLLKISYRSLLLKIQRHKITHQTQ